jgi:uncharacterized protein (TIGR03435 family)
LLYRYTGRVVVDKASLTGNYTLALRFAAVDSRSAVPSTEGVPSDAGPSVFTAVKEQLGLELKSGKGPIEVLIVERFDPPTEN